VANRLLTGIVRSKEECWNIRIAVMYRVYYKSSEHRPNDSERDRTNVGMIANVAIGMMTNIPQLEISGEMLL
jgi:hypothetical protein